jgi:hypothetical protein
LRLISGLEPVSCNVTASLPQQKIFEQKCLDGTAVIYENGEDPR